MNVGSLVRGVAPWHHYYSLALLTERGGVCVEDFQYMAVSLLFIFYEKVEKTTFVSKVFWYFGLICWALGDGSQIVDLVEIYRPNFLLFIFDPWTSCLRSK